MSYDLFNEKRNQFVINQEQNFLNSKVLPSYGKYSYSTKSLFNEDYPIDFSKNAPQNHRPYYEFIRPDIDDQDTYQPPYNFRCENELVPMFMLSPDTHNYITKQQYNKFNKYKFNGVGFIKVP